MTPLISTSKNIMHFYEFMVCSLPKSIKQYQFARLISPSLLSPSLYGISRIFFIDTDKKKCYTEIGEKKILCYAHYTTQ